MKILLLFLIIFQAHAAAQPWVKTTPKAAGVKSSEWDAFLSYAKSTEHGFSTNALMVIYKGQLIEHSTFNGFKKGQTHRQWSVSKSITSTLIGIAIKKGLLTLETPVKKYYPLHKDTKYSPVLKELLGMSSGLDWNEGYESNPLKSSVIAMLYTEGYKDMASFTAARPFRAIPGEKFYYSSGETNLIMGMLKKTMGQNDYANYPWSQLFDPMGIKSATWERDGSDTFVGSSYLYMAPEDLALIGMLYLNNGVFKGKRFLSKEWVKFSYQLSNPFFKYTKEKIDDSKNKRVETYGAQWWLNADVPGFPNSHPYPGLPTDAYMALGHHGQILLIVPSKKLVLVRNGADKESKLDRVKFFDLLTKALP
ncbi:MAG: CubicO group peptidase (beta-lactamase class C family) [Bacteriovoracaceae bacterium]|jgi:CubicO group peptidase (beta-lactamase class C family)